MSDERTCLACGHEGPDVRMTLVKYPDPQPVDVVIASTHDSHGRVTGNEFRKVPGRYGSEWRCTDKAACAQRQADEARARRGQAPW